jgi:hypothetical protein
MRGLHSACQWRSTAWGCAQRAKGAGGGETSLARGLKGAVNAATVWLKKNSLFFEWFTRRLGVALRPLGFKGFGQVGEVKHKYVDSNPPSAASSSR